MIILGHMYHLGWGWGGGVVTMVLLLDELRRRGHQARLMLQRGQWSNDSFGGREIGVEKVYGNPLPRAKVRAYEQADLVITQGEATPEAMRLAGRYHKPLAHLVHDEGQLRKYGAKPGQVQLAIYNARWTMEAAAAEGRTERAVLVNPLVFPDAFATERGEAICLVNTCPAKGGQLFWALTARMPERRFLAVRGGWGAQIVHLLPNAEVIGHQLDPRDIYRRCRIMLMPSQPLGTPGPNWDWTESWGRVAIEAAASGIPTIAHPTPGLLESLGSAGIFADRNDVEAWARAIEELDDPDRYAQASAAALARSAELAEMQTGQLDELEAALYELAGVARAAVPSPPPAEEGTEDMIHPASEVHADRPQETQELPPSLERKAPKERTSGVVVTYACAHCRASGFASRDALRDHAAAEHGAAVRGDGDRGAVEGLTRARERDS